MKIHYTENYLLSPVHPISVALIGAGGTGSQVLQCLSRIDYALYKLGHRGLYVKVFDDDIVTEANIGRQLFCPSDMGLNKAQVLVSRANTFYGTSWECVQERFPEGCEANECYNIIISCVDSAKARMEIGEYLEKYEKTFNGDESTPYYWLDFGNGTVSGQVILGTLRKIKQPKKSKYKTVSTLKCVNKFFNLKKVNEEDSGPSCSLAEALRKQDLFINSSLAQLGCNLLWKMITEGSVSMQGMYVNLETMKVNPIQI